MRAALGRAFPRILHGAAARLPAGLGTEWSPVAGLLPLGEVPWYCYVTVVLSVLVASSFRRYLDYRVNSKRLDFARMALDKITTESMATVVIAVAGNPDMYGRPPPASTGRRGRTGQRRPANPGWDPDLIDGDEGKESE